MIAIIIFLSICLAIALYTILVMKILEEEDDEDEYTPGMPWRRECNGS